MWIYKHTWHINQALDSVKIKNCVICMHVEHLKVAFFEVLFRATDTKKQELRVISFSRSRSPCLYIHITKAIPTSARAMRAAVPRRLSNPQTQCSSLISTTALDNQRMYYHVFGFNKDLSYPPLGTLTAS